MKTWPFAAALLLPWHAWAQSAQNAAAFVQNAVNPDLSVIADFAAVGVNQKDETAAGLAIPGFLDQTDRGGKTRGLDFNYFEMTFQASVDPYFSFLGVATVTDAGIDIEEAYVDARTLPWGLGLRAGKFFSAFGRLNSMHQHTWDFYDAPLIYEVVTGGEGMKAPGLRLSWTAPLDILLQANLEVFQASFEGSRTFGAGGYHLAALDGTQLSADAPTLPLAWAGSVKTSFDFGKHVFLLGGSLMLGPTALVSIAGTPADSAFTAANTWLYGGELTYKYLLSSYRSLSLQVEYLGRHSPGKLALASDGLVHDLVKDQGGLYAQLVWRFDEAGGWRVGARYDLLAQNRLVLDGREEQLTSLLPRYTAMLELSPTEFSRLRLQYDYDRSRYSGGVQRDLHEIVLQLNIAVGPHGAHSF